MKTVSEDLFRLIQGLNQGEKRYCRLELEKKNLQNAAIKLQIFDEIYKDQGKTEEEIRQWLKEINFKNDFTILKHHLKEQILTALHHYYENNQDKARLYKQFHEAQILLEKGLTKACQSKLKSLKKEAGKFEFHYLLMEITELEKSLVSNVGSFQKDLARINELYETNNARLQYLTSENSYWVAFMRLYQYHIRQLNEPIANEFPQVAQLLKGEKPDFSVKPLTFKARLDYYQARALSFFMNGNQKEALRFNRAFLRYFEGHPKQINHYAKRYLAVYNNYLIDGLTLGKYDEVDKGIQRLREFGQRNEFRKITGMQEEIFRLSTLLEMNLHLSRQDFRKGAKVSQDIEPLLEEYKLRIPGQFLISMYYLSAYFHFITGFYQEALKWVRHIFDDFGQDVPVRQVYEHAQLLFLIIHFELQNFDYLEYALENARKQMRKTYSASHVFLLTIRHLQELSELPVSEKGKDHWQDYLGQIREQDMASQQIFDFKSWALSHLRNLSMENVMKTETEPTIS